ncbi:MAG: class I SAM-dependent methyltransferase [Cyclobacteriaceae bacterium]
MSKKNCILCGADSFKKLYKKKGFDIEKCKSCSLIRTDIPKNFNIKSIYGHDYFQGGKDDGYLDYVGSRRVLSREFSRLSEEIYNQVDQLNDRKLKLLEVGCAYGFFLEEASNYFDCYGIEVSIEASSYAKSNGHKVFGGDVSEENLSKIGAVDIIVMLDVIEHLENPLATLELLQKYLKRGGSIIIVTGNIDSILYKLMGKNWRLMTPPQHTYFFSKKTLVKSLQKCRLEVVSVSRPWKFVPLGLAFYQLGSRIGFRLKRLETLNNLGMYVNLFDVVKVIAIRKE